MVRIPGYTGSGRRRRLALLGAVFSSFALLGLVVVPAAQAVHDLGVFELDKDAIQGETTLNLGTLKSNISAATNPIVVCRNATTEPSTPFTIQIDAERMSVTAAANATGGGCSPKRSYTVVRGFSGTTAAAHSGGGNVSLITAATVTGNDWDQVYAENVADPDTKCTDLGATECAFVHDGQGVSIFTTGGSKDDLDVPNWRWTDGSVPDADEILDAFAAKYESGGDQILYFGADRYAVNGSKDFGFWFFKNPVGTNPDGTFSGTHSGTLAVPGDILILGTFTGGGAVTTVRVFRWVGTGGNATANGTVQGPDASFADCVPGVSNDDGCGTVNNTTIKSPWAYVGKATSAADNILSGGFVEGGINLSNLGLAGCFSSFLAETRSSPSVDAQLKDFILGQFEACGSELSTTPVGGDLSIGTGSVQATDSALLNVTGTDTFSGTLSFHICGPIASGTCDTGGVAAGSQTVTTNGTYTSNPVTLTSVGRYCWRGDFTSDTEGVPDASDSSPSECFNVAPATPELSTSAGDDVILGNPITDTASLTGTANQPGDNGGNATYPSINATNGALADGTITFTLVSSDDCATVPTGFSPIVVTVSGDSTTAYTASFTPTAPGSYTWIAEYSGNSPNTNGAGPTGCPEANEEVIVTGNAHVSTAQDWLPNDTATLTGDTNLNGTLTFTLYASADCTGTAVPDQSYTVNVVDAASGSEFHTTNTTFKVQLADQGSYSWLVHYDDDSLTDPPDTCETSTLTIDDDVPVGP